MADNKQVKKKDPGTPDSAKKKPEVPVAAEKFDVKIISPDKVILEETSVRMMVPGVVDEIAILPDHTPMYAQLANGDVVIYKDKTNSEKTPIDGGILRVKNNKVTILLGFEDEDVTG